MKRYKKNIQADFFRANLVFTILLVLFSPRILSQNVEISVSDTCETVRFGIITDVQYCPCESKGNRFFSKSLQKIKTAVDTLNTKDLSFTISLGDVIDRDFQCYDSILPKIRKLNMPVFFAYGNHDYNVADSQKNKIDSVHRQQNSYFTFKRNNWRFIVLNTSDVSLYAYPKNSIPWFLSDSIYKQQRYQKFIQAKMWNGGVGEKQIRWMKQCLDTASRLNESVLIFGHHPFYPKREHNAWNDSAMVSILEQYPCVKAYFCGHNHAGEYAVKNNIQYLTLKGMVEGQDVTSFSWVELLPTAIRVHGFGSEVSREINLLP